METLKRITGSNGNEDIIKIPGSLLARNTLFNLIGQAIPLLVGLVTIPFVVRGLGTEQFGLFSLAWIILGYFAIFDLGLGRATTKYVAEAFGIGEEEQIPQIIWTAVFSQMILGIIGAGVLFGITDFLIEMVLNIPLEIQGEAKVTFHLLALSIPVVLVSSSFSGVLEAAQRFDLVNIVRIPSTALTFLLPLIGLYLGFSLPGIVGLILLARLGLLIVLIGISYSVIPNLKEYSVSSALFLRLFSFGGWVTISNIIIPIFVYLDRFLIGALLTLSALSYYAIPYEVVSRLLIIPSSIASVLFPTFSSLASSKDNDRIAVLLMRSIKYLLTIMVPLIVILLLFSQDFLEIWVGNDFAEESTTTFRILCIAILLNAIGYSPSVLIQGIGRPDIVAKYHFVELPIYFIVAFLFINQFGINGAAFAWCLRMAWSIPIFFFLCTRIAEVPLKSLSENGTNRSIIAAVGILLPSIIFLLLGEWNILVSGFIAGVLVISSVLISWYFTFDRTDKDFTKSIFLRVFILKLNKDDDAHV